MRQLMAAHTYPCRFSQCLAAGFGEWLSWRHCERSLRSVPLNDEVWLVTCLCASLSDGVDQAHVILLTTQ